MQISTPISESKSAALSRVLDATVKGYTRYVSGQLPTAKLEAFLKKFHQRYAIAASPAQRLTHQKHGKANALLTVYQPKNCEIAEWVMQVSQGTNFENEILKDVTSKLRLNWLGYELFRYANKGRTSWTWRRPKEEMAEHYLMMRRYSELRRMDEIEKMLIRLGNQPGFHGVREQSKELFREAQCIGYKGMLPKLFFMSKVSHGEKVVIGN